MDSGKECLQKMAGRCYLVADKKVDTVLQYKYSSLRSKKKFITLKSYPLSDKVFFMYKLMPNDCFEIGIVAGKKVGNAVKRNYAKRRLRHAILLAMKNTDAVPKAILLLVAKKPILTCNFATLANTLSLVYDKLCK